MIIKNLKIAIVVGIFSIVFTFFSVYRFVSNDNIIGFYESFIEKFSKKSSSDSEAVQSIKNSEAAEEKGKNKKESQLKDKKAENDQTKTKTKT